MGDFVELLGVLQYFGGLGWPLEVAWLNTLEGRCGSATLRGGLFTEKYKTAFNRQDTLLEAIQRVRNHVNYLNRIGE